jgi:hypothetical protein
VDNVYSHRSTQKYKRKPFVSHYWDCRLKGRPPGTPKSDDPNKKKRKRTARERDLCDVKIKITEYFPGAMLRPDFVPDGEQGPDGNSSGNSFFSPVQPVPLAVQQQSFGMLTAANGVASNHPGSTGHRYYTIQRVNGNGGNGKGDGVAGPHKHTLEESDKVKKNSVQRFMAKKDKVEKKTQVSDFIYVCYNLSCVNSRLFIHLLPFPLHQGHRNFGQQSLYEQQRHVSLRLYMTIHVDPGFRHTHAHLPLYICSNFPDFRVFSISPIFFKSSSLSPCLTLILNRKPITRKQVAMHWRQ